MTDIMIDELDDNLLQTHTMSYNGIYVIARQKGVGTTTPLHRLIMKAPEGFVVDHLNGKRKDNTRRNLRVCTKSANANNLLGSILLSNKTFCGVHWNGEAWITRVCELGQVRTLGEFTDVVEANKTYVAASPARCTCSGERPDRGFLRQLYEGTDTLVRDRLLVEIPAGWKEILQDIGARDERSVGWLTRKALSSTYPQLTASDGRADEVEKGSK